MKLRPQCVKCPWRDMEAMDREFPQVVAYASTKPGGFVCHTRMGPCDGPRHAGVAEA